MSHQSVTAESPTKLTTASARVLEPPSGKTDHFVWDKDFPGFGVRVRVGRNRISRMWIYQYDTAGRTRRITLGNVSGMGIEDARKNAGRLQSNVRLGNDPAQEKAEKLERATHTFGRTLKIFLEEKKRTTRGSTWRVTCHLLGEPCKSLYLMPLVSITRRDIAEVLTPIAARGKLMHSNNVRNKLLTFFNWAIKKGLTESNPVLGTEKQDTKARERVLSMDELVAVWHTLDDMTDYATVVRLLMLTGQRRTEIGEMTWPEIRTEKTFINDGLPVDGPAIVLPPERIKNDRKFIVPLSTAAQAILLTCPRGPDDTLVFRRNNNPQSSPAYARTWSRHKKMLDAALVKNGHNLEPWVLHDLRRSVATHMRHMGIARDTVEEVLNHFRANVYIKGQLEGAKRQAIEAWGEYLMAHVEGRQPVDNVVQGQFRA